MQIERVFNNNVVSVVDDGREAILTGRGLGFGRRRGDAVDTALVEKRFVLDSGESATSIAALLDELPYEVIAVTDRIATLAGSELGVHLRPSVHFGLADHITAAVERARQGRRLDNPLLWEIKSAYAAEFRVAAQALRLIESATATSLPVEEVGFLTMHLVNANLTGDMTSTLRSAEAVRQIVSIVRGQVRFAAGEDSSDYGRFLTHIKYFVARLEEGTPLADRHPEMFAALRVSDGTAHACAVAVASYAEAVYGVQVPDDELLYLMLHISRITHRPSPS